MRFQEKLHEYTKEEIWDEYCGFLTMTPAEFMNIQRRLLMEQMEIWTESALGQRILKGNKPKTIEDDFHSYEWATEDDKSFVLVSFKVDETGLETYTGVSWSSDLKD